MSIKTLLNEIALAHLERKTQQELQRLRAIAQAAAIVAQDERVRSIKGGQELVDLVLN